MAITKIKIVEATQEYVDLMKPNMRILDDLECLATSGRNASEAVQTGLEESSQCYIALACDEPVACFGVAPTGINGWGTPWMLATKDLAKVNKMVIAKLNRKYIAQFLKEYIYLENWIDERNKLSINWLEWCGFNIEPAKPYGIEGLPFHRFWMEREES